MALIVALLAVAIGGCGPVSPGPPLSETGIVIGADGPNASEVDRFSLRTADGRVLAFTVGRLDLGNGGLPAPHLREHLISGEPITVWFYGAEVIRYEDAPPD